VGVELGGWELFGWGSGCVCMCVRVLGLIGEEGWVVCVLSVCVGWVEWVRVCRS